MRWISLLMAAVVGFGAYAGEKNVGVLWYEKSGMADRVCQGFLAQLQKRSPEIKVECKMALKDQTEAATVYADFQKAKDAVVFLRSEGAVFMSKNPPEKPSFIGAANNPAVLGVIKNMEAPEGNITGVTYYLPARRHLELYKKLLPQMKSVALVVQEGHPSAPVETSETKAACAELGLQYKEAQFPKLPELLNAVKELAPQVDALIIGNQNLVFDNAALIASIAGKTPVLSYSEKPLTAKQALAGLVASDVKLGGLLADSVISVLVEGKKVSEVPVKMDSEPVFTINLTKARELGLTVPEELLTNARKIE